MRNLLALIFLGGAAFGGFAETEREWIEKRVEELQPASKEKRFDEIGWANDIRHAKKLAREHHRPVFLFTHDGRMNLGRC